MAGDPPRDGIYEQVIRHIMQTEGATPSSIEISETQKGPQVTVKMYFADGGEDYNRSAEDEVLRLYWRAKDQLAQEARRRMEEAMAALHKSDQEGGGGPE